MGIDIALFVDSVPEDCVCCICREVLEEPQETLTCQHAFCSSCIITWLREHNSCPACRCPLSLNELTALHRVWREKLNGLKLKCRNFYIGCDAVMHLEEVDYHMDICPFVRVTCPHNPCNEVVVRSHLQHHLEVCDYRKATCPSCQLSVPWVSLKTHDCISALREDMCHRLDMLKKEWAESLRVVRKDCQKLHDKFREQARELAELKYAVAAASKVTVQHLPTINVTEKTRRVSNKGALATRRTSRTTQQDIAQTTNLSLPRVAPLHIHMSLSRGSGAGFSDESRSHHSHLHEV